MCAGAQSAEPAHRKILASLIESFVKSYRLHLEAEDKIFFPLAEEMLEPADWAAIDAEMARMPDPLFGDRALLDYPSLYPVMLGGKAQ
jgi:hemerythrin-like domain-containing protein